MLTVDQYNKHAIRQALEGIRHLADGSYWLGWYALKDAAEWAKKADDKMTADNDAAAAAAVAPVKQDAAA